MNKLTALALIALVLAIVIIVLQYMTIIDLQDLSGCYEQVLQEAVDQITEDIQFIEELQKRIEIYEKILDGRIKVTITPKEEVTN